MTARESYTVFPNYVLEELISGKFTKNEMKVILMVIRQTFGYHREESPLSLKFISECTKVDKRRICDSIKTLFDKKAIEEVKSATRNKPREIRLGSALRSGVKASFKNDFSGDENANTKGDESANSFSGQKDTQENKYKNKTINKDYSPKLSKRGCITDGFDPDEFFKAALAKRGI